MTTSATDINEICKILEVQNIQCNVTSGTFGLSLGGETAYIVHDAYSNDTKKSLESLSVINHVTVDFINGKELACAPFDGTFTGDFSTQGWPGICLSWEPNPVA
jgi:hypothetical protein